MRNRHKLYTMYTESWNSESVACADWKCKQIKKFIILRSKTIFWGGKLTLKGGVKNVFGEFYDFKSLP